MRQIVIDELSPMERDNIDSYLKRNCNAGPMIGLYWVLLPDNILSEIQKEHGDCGPFYCGIEVEQDSVRFELLVRSSSNLHCKCISYATTEQRLFLLNFIDNILEEEKIKA